MDVINGTGMGAFWPGPGAGATAASLHGSEWGGLFAASMAQPNSVRSSIALFLATAGLMTVTVGCSRPPAGVEGGEGKPALTSPDAKDAGASHGKKEGGADAGHGKDAGEGGEGGEG
jgi:hypothetical protein